ncbi:MAG TPA: PDZ domain-containing protein [Gemmatimonadaceae bacterium]|nr:PDZ domain-containing protein [Gemmatimonadaceae bacterium]
MRVTLPPLLALLLAWPAVPLASPTLAAQDAARAFVQGAEPAVSAPVSDVRFEVTLGAPEVAARRVGVRATMRVEGKEPVLLSMSAWTPGAYEISNFARHVSDFTAMQDGRELDWDKLDPDTWRVIPAERGTIEIRYAVRADSLDTAQGWTGRDFGFFNGTTVFLMVEGRLGLPATVGVLTEPGWLVTSGMTPDTSAAARAAAGNAATPATRRFRAADFHDLVDHPFFVGRFDLDSTMVAGRWMRLATYPEGSVAAGRRMALWDALERSVAPLAAVFGEVPWRSYTVMQVVDPDFGGMSALEHTESELAIVGAPYLDEPFVVSIHAHEIAHAWNVKRLRPADLFPYVYDRPQPTEWLWMSEGVTDYYADLALVRAGLIDEAGFLAATLRKIDGVAARSATALEDASLQAWIGMTDGTADLYYDKGSLAGLALDIVIRDASDNQRSLDDVMRELWTKTWKQGRGFTDDDFWNAATRAADGRALGDFRRRFIDGRQRFPWHQWLERAGWRIVTDSITEPRLGALLRAHERGVSVSALDPDGAGARAGLELGDVITHIGGRPTLDPDFGRRWREFWGKRPGAPMALTVLRGDETHTLTATVELTTLVDRHVEPATGASNKARRIRAGILRGRTDR